MFWWCSGCVLVVFWYSGGVLVFRTPELVFCLVVVFRTPPLHQKTSTTPEHLQNNTRTPDHYKNTTRTPPEHLNTTRTLKHLQTTTRTLKHHQKSRTPRCSGFLVVFWWCPSVLVVLWLCYGVQNTTTGVLSGGGVLVFRTPPDHQNTTRTPPEH